MGDRGAEKPLCPGCRTELDVISATGRADDLFLCSKCFHSWYAFELARDEPVDRTPSGDE